MKTLGDIQKWEYKVVTYSVRTIPDDSTGMQVLNEAGAEGWEAVNATGATDGEKVLILLKRPKLAP